jgi:hypothetical protein
LRWESFRKKVERTNRKLYALSAFLIILGVLTYIYGVRFSGG